MSQQLTNEEVKHFKWFVAEFGDRIGKTMSYSGRSMFGKICPAFRYESDADLFAFAVSLGRKLGEDEENGDLTTEERATMEKFATARIATDNLGLGFVAYFPSLLCSSNSPLEEDEED